MIKDLLFSSDYGSDDLKITVYDFNEDDDRFCITCGDDSELNNEDSYRLRFLNMSEAIELRDFLNEHIK